MEHSKLTWEDVSKFEEIKVMDNMFGDIMRNIFVTDEGGIAEQRVVYELPLELFQSPYQVFPELLEKSNLI